MRAVFRQPKWIVATVAVVVIAAVFVRLGFWQLDRLEERRAANAIGQERLAAEPERLPDLLAEAGDDLESIEFRRVVVEGTYDPSREVLIRSQVELGQAGFHVITPLRTDQGWSVLVNRGWVPLPMDTPPVEPAPAPGEVRQEGWVHLTEPRPPLGREDAPGDVSVFNRVDIGRIGEQVDDVLAPVYVVSLGEGSEELPIPVDLPDFTDEGPHLAYAIQWFGFALVGLVGFYFLVRNKGVQGK